MIIPKAKSPFLNDYPATYYRDTAAAQPQTRPPLSVSTETDICVIGGGLSGLCTALSLAERGRKVLLIEKMRIGWSASGRNGGLVLSGFDYGMGKVAQKVGPEKARAIFKLTLNALDLIKTRVRAHDIPCGTLPPGIAILACTGSPGKIQADVDRHNQIFGSTWTAWGKDETQEKFRSSRYKGATFMPETFQIQPLDFCFGLANAIEASGGIIHEHTECTSIARDRNGYRLTTGDGLTIGAQHVVYAVSADARPALSVPLYAATMPINTYIGVTEPLTEAQRQASINCSHAAYDSRHIMNYYRLLPDNRLLWGGGAGVFMDPDPLANYMKADLLKFFPALKDVRMDVAWSGTMGCSRHRMPQIGRLKSGLWYATNHCGQGLATTTMAGTLIADAICETGRDITLFEPFGLDFTGGRMGRLAASAFCGYLGVLDRLEQITD